MRKTNLLLLVIICLASTASAATRYVSDDLHTYLHSGPGTKYKIVGSVNTGEHIKVIQRNSGFTQIRDSKGRSGWINSKYVSNQLGLKERLPKLEIQLKELKTQLNASKENSDSHSSQVRELQKRNSTLNKELEEVQSQNRNLNAKLDTQKNDLLMRWFSYGGMVGGIGLILGLVLPSLIPSRRKKTSW